MKVRIGTRESLLALSQTNIIVNLIMKEIPSAQIEIVKIKTSGDKILDKTLDKVGGKGLFIKELEHALLKNEIDLAVHSLKDVPASLADGLCLSCYTEREDPRDVLISRFHSIEELKTNSIVGTSSVRREMQLKALRPDCIVKPLRGNVITRISKLNEGHFDAVILAKAGLKRLSINEIDGFNFIPLDKSQMVPAIGQGILCVESRQNSHLNQIMSAINCPDSELIATCERAVMEALGGNCFTPLSCYAEIWNTHLQMTGFLGTTNKSQFVKDYISVCLPDAIVKNSPLTLELKKFAENAGKTMANSLHKKLDNLRGDNL